MDTKDIIGKAEQISFPELGITELYARIDTGAKTSSIWASRVTIENGVLSVVFFGEAVAAYTGQPVLFDQFEVTAVSTSTGEVQQRYKVRLAVKIKNRKIRAWFTLADRSTQVYPVLIGRNVLLGKFIVDVKQGQSLKRDEKRRTEALQSKIEQIDKENI